MSDLRMIFDHECECGKVSHIDTGKCDKKICPKCGEVVFEKFKTLEDTLEDYKQYKRKQKLAELQKE